MKAKKTLIEAAKRNGTFTRVDKVLSLAYLCRQLSYTLYGEADYLLRTGGLLIGETKKLSTRLDKAFDDYFNDFKQMIDNDTAKSNFFADYESFSRMVHAWAELPEDFTPGTDI